MTEGIYDVISSFETLTARTKLTDHEPIQEQLKASNCTVLSSVNGVGRRGEIGMGLASIY